MFSVKRSDHDVSDLVLVDRVRAGDDAAFGGLWTRHSDAGIRAARQISHRFDPEDLVQEAFTRVLSAIRGGKGPRDAFRPYLYASIRAVSMNWTRDRAKEYTLDDLSSQVDVDAMFEDVLLEQTVTGQAFKSLRPEWRTILWYTAVEGMSAREAGPLLGLSANAAAALAYRAREGLRVAWLQAHVSSEEVDPACAWTVDRIGIYQRGGLRRKDAAAVEEHIAVCATCAILVREAADLANNLKGILLPLVLAPGILSLDAAGVGSLGGAAGAVVTGKLGAASSFPGGSVGASVGTSGSSAGAGVGASTATATATGAGAIGGTAAMLTAVSLVVVTAVAGLVWTASRTPSLGDGRPVAAAESEDRSGRDPRARIKKREVRTPSDAPVPSKRPAATEGASAAPSDPAIDGVDLLPGIVAGQEQGRSDSSRSGTDPAATQGAPAETRTPEAAAAPPALAAPDSGPARTADPEPKPEPTPEPTPDPEPAQPSQPAPSKPAPELPGKSGKGPSIKPGKGTITITIEIGSSRPGKGRHLGVKVWKKESEPGIVGIERGNGR